MRIFAQVDPNGSFNGPNAVSTRSRFKCVCPLGRRLDDIQGAAGEPADACHRGSEIEISSCVSPDHAWSKKQQWKSRDCFLVPLKDTTFLVAQVLRAEPTLLNSVSCALFNRRTESSAPPKPSVGSLFSTLFTTRDLLDLGEWRVFAAYPVEVPREIFPFEPLREAGWVGAKVIGSRTVNSFANAYCGLELWDDWHDPNYLDRLLLSPELKPQTLMLKA